MSGTPAGGIKTREINIKKYGYDYYQKLGAKGGSVTGPEYKKYGSKAKGFAYDSRNSIEKLIGIKSKAEKFGKIGGRISRRTKNVTA